jgi:hypothetical protein
VTFGDGSGSRFAANAIQFAAPLAQSLFIASA